MMKVAHSKKRLPDPNSPTAVFEYPVLYKDARDEQEAAWLRRHHECLKRMGGNQAPRSLLQPGVAYSHRTDGVEFLWPEEDLGQSEVLQMHEEVKFQRGCVRLLNLLANAGIRHGDLTRHNIIVKNGLPCAIDFHQALFEGETADPKRPEPDAHWLWHAASELSPDTTRRIRRWRVIREYLEPETTLIDYGTAEGDFVLMAEAEHKGINACGYDTNRASLEQFGRDNVFYGDITKLDNYKCDTALFMSVFPYLIHEKGLSRAIHTLKRILFGAQQTFFETQLFGDGPGVDLLQTKNDVYTLLKTFAPPGAGIEELITIPVYGRPYSRTVWRIQQA